MIISTLRASKRPRFPGALTSLKSTSRGFCNTNKMAKPDHSERTAAEPRDPVRDGAVRSFHEDSLLIQWSRPTVAPHGHPQADRRGQPLHPHLPPQHPTVRGEHQGKRVCVCVCVCVCTLHIKHPSERLVGNVARLSNLAVSHIPSRPRR
jgi:hypothetical protein